MSQRVPKNVRLFGKSGKPMQAAMKLQGSPSVNAARRTVRVHMLELEIFSNLPMKGCSNGAAGHAQLVA